MNLPDLAKLGPGPSTMPAGSSVGGQRNVIVVGDDGIPKKIGIPNLPAEYWVDPAGFVCPLAINTTRNVAQVPTRTNVYSTWIKQLKARDGWIPYHYQMAYCLGIPAEHWPKYRDEQMALRQAKHNRDMAKYAEAQERRERAQADRIAEAIATGMAAGIDQAKGKKGKGE